jgi:tetratricopeptide (TPR) repeat protein
MTDIFKEADKLRNQGKSLEAAKKYLELTKITLSDYQKAAAYHMAGVSFSQSGSEINKAESCFENATKYYKSFKDSLNLARVIRDRGILKLNTSDFKSAKDLLEESVKLLESLNTPEELAMSQAKLAVVFAKLKKSEEASRLAVGAVLNANKSDNTFYIATAYQEFARVEFLNQKFEAMLAPLYSALGALMLESDPHAKRHAELYLSLNLAYSKLDNQSLAEKTLHLAETYLKELDKQTAERIRGYFKK